MNLHVSINAFDVFIILIYLLTIVGMGCWAGLRQQNASDGDAYFLAGRSLRWPVIGLALFSTNISTLELVSLAQEGYRTGLVYGNLELLAPVTLLLLAIVFVPFYLRSGVTTLPDFLEKRYGRACRRLLVVLSMASAIFIHLGFAIFTGGKVIEGLFGIDLILGMTIVLGLTGLYTIIGGLEAVALTEAVQAIVLIAGSSIITIVAMQEVGGWEGLTAALAIEPERLKLLRSADVEPAMAWHAIFLGYPVIGIWYWCTDQTIVQRALGAKDQQHAQVGAIFTGFIKILALFIFILPGVACYAMVKQGKIDPLSDSAQTLPYLISNLLPAGIKGIVVAALLAALMGTISGALNSIATLFCYDVYREWRPHATERQMVYAGRIVTIVAMVMAIAWAPMIDRFGSILEGNTAMICYLAPCITTVFLWGVLWKSASSIAALVTLTLGSCLGFIVFLLDWHKETTGWNVPFMMGSFYLFLICSFVMILVSWIAPHQHTDESRSLVWQHPFEMLRQPAWSGVLNYQILSLLLLSSIVLVYVVLG